MKNPKKISTEAAKSFADDFLKDPFANTGSMKRMAVSVRTKTGGYTAAFVAVFGEDKETLKEGFTDPNEDIICLPTHLIVAVPGLPAASFPFSDETEKTGAIDQARQYRKYLYETYSL